MLSDQCDISVNKIMKEFLADKYWKGINEQFDISKEDSFIQSTLLN